MERHLILKCRISVLSAGEVPAIFGAQKHIEEIRHLPENRWGAGEHPPLPDVIFTLFH